jgi:VanZ family protein
MKIFFIFIKPVIWLALICYGLFLPANNLPIKPFFQIPHFDKLVHFGLFFVFSLLLFRPYKKLKTRYIFWAPVTALLSGIILESAQQALSSSRNSDVYDLIANVAGIFTSIFAYQIYISGKKWEKLF